MSDNQQIMRDFMAVVNSNNIDRIMEFFAPDCFFHNVPLEPAKGTEAIREVLMSVLSISTEVEWTVHNIAETAEGHVMTERTDAFAMNGIWVRLLVMGIFELENGKITSWRDYFDANQMVQMMTEEYDSDQ